MILPASDPASIARAARALAAGELVAFPTETVYGLGADALQDDAVAKIFAAKGRPTEHPLIVHVADPDPQGPAVARFAADVPDFARRLMHGLWPGPLTLILPRRADVARAAAGGQGTIGLRCPSQPVARALLEACAGLGVAGVAAPSANRFGRVSPTRAEHVVQEFGPALLVLDGGACEVGIESAIVDCSRGAPVLLRPGLLTRAQVEAACGQRLLAPDELGGAPRASGTLAAHYAPNAKLRLMDARQIETAVDLLGDGLERSKAKIAVYARHLPAKARGQLLLRRMPDDAAATAQQLFAVLREFDAAGAALIWVETVPDTPDWDGVRDRLARAAA